MNSKNENGKKINDKDDKKKGAKKPEDKKKGDSRRSSRSESVAESTVEKVEDKKPEAKAVTPGRSGSPRPGSARQKTSDALKSKNYEDLVEERLMINMTDENYDSVVASERRILVFFQAPWCSVCHKLIPRIYQLANELLKDYPDYRLGTLDCSVYEETAEKLGLTTLPAMKLYVDGEFIADYSGGRTVKDMKEFIVNAGNVDKK